MWLNSLEACCNWNKVINDATHRKKMPVKERILEPSTYTFIIYNDTALKFIFLTNDI